MSLKKQFLRHNNIHTLFTHRTMNQNGGRSLVAKEEQRCFIYKSGEPEYYQIRYPDYDHRAIDPDIDEKDDYRVLV